MNPISFAQSPGYKSMALRPPETDPRFLSVDPHGDSVRLDKLTMSAPYVEPHHLYLVYIAIDNNGLVVRHLEKDISPANIGAEEDGLITQARNGVAHATNFDVIKFTKPSFFTVVLDQDDWDFYYPDPANREPDLYNLHDPIEFMRSKTVLVEIPAASGNWIRVERLFSRNQAFYNAQALDKEVGGISARKAVRCINFFTKNAAGDLVGPNETFNYGFNIVIRVPFSITSPNEKVTLIIDPDGQNQGPPP